MTTNVQDVMTGVVSHVDGDAIDLRVPHTDYVLRLHVEGPAPSAGDRVRGVIHATAMRLHPAAGGGRSIEPIIGEPRIVMGSILEVDADARRVLLNVAVPMWLELDETQDLSVLTPGAMANGYVRSGARFVPVAD